MVRDRAAAREHGLGRPGLDIAPLLELRPTPYRREHREIESRTVRIHVREAAGDATAAAGLAHRLSSCVDHGGMKGREAVPGDRRLESLAQDPRRDEHVT